MTAAVAVDTSVEALLVLAEHPAHDLVRAWAAQGGRLVLRRRFTGPTALMS